MRDLILVFVFFISLGVSAQDTAIVTPPQTAPGTHLLTKADSLMAVIAAKQGIDTNASAAEIGALIDDSLKLVPGKHAGPLAWWKFVISLVAVIAAAWFFVKHQVLKGKVAQVNQLNVDEAAAESPNRGAGRGDSAGT